MRRGQEGLTLMGFVIVLIVVGIFAYFVMLIVPMYTEYYSVKQGLMGTVREPGIATADPYTITDKISRHFETGYVSSIQPKDIKVKRDTNGLTLTADYEVRKQIGQTSLYILAHFVDVESTAPQKAGATP